MITRRAFLKYTGGTALTLFAFNKFGVPKAIAQISGGTLDPNVILKFQTPLLIPPVMPTAGRIVLQGGKNADYYEISMKQFQQQILPLKDIYDNTLIQRLSGAMVPWHPTAKEGCYCTMPHR